MMVIGARIGSKSFSDEDRNKAYKKAVKFILKLITWQQLQYNIKEEQTEEGYKFTVSFYTVCDLNSEMNRHCSICKELHSSFFFNDNFNCNACKLKSFQHREKERLNISKNAFKKKIQNE